jgi:thiol-disulfide isomerase/thioredoxin
MDTIRTSDRIRFGRRWLFGLAAGGISAARLGMSTSAQGQAAKSATSLPSEGEMPSLAGATGWINTPPLTAADLRGKVVLVEFWTYTCINWLRSHAYVRAWAEKYKQHGLVVIGAHAPEFPFERDIDNVRRAAEDMKIRYPVAVDSNYAIWQAFENSYWPPFYFVEAQGRIRHHQFGEGSYQRSEKIIQLLLAETGSVGITDGLVSADGQGIEAPADWANLRSQENCLGYERTENFSSVGGSVLGRSRLYAAPVWLTLNQWALSGHGTMDRGFAAPNAVGGKIAYRFHARDVRLVMGSSDPSKPIRFRVRIDGALPGPDHGLDIDAEGWGSVQEPRLYQLVRQPRAIMERTVEIEFAKCPSRNILSRWNRLCFN